MNQYTLLRIKERMNKELYDTLKTHMAIDETMTRQEEIRQEALKAEKEKFPRCAGDKENSFHGVNSAYDLGFVDGSLWADNNPKSPWIKANDYLPNDETKLYIIYCEAYNRNGDDIENKHYEIYLANFDKETSSWVNVESYSNYIFNVLYWMPLPEPPKE